MRIRKVSPEIPLSGNVENTYGNSQVDAYSQEYQNKHNVVVSSTEPTNKDAIWVQYGKNLLDPDGIIPNTIISTQNGTAITNSVWSATSFINVKPNTTYTFSTKQVGTGTPQISIHQYNGTEWVEGTQYNVISQSFTTGSNITNVRLCYRNDINYDELQLVTGGTATTYEAYIKPTINVNNNGIYDEILQKFNWVEKTGEITFVDTNVNSERTRLFVNEGTRTIFLQIYYRGSVTNSVTDIIEFPLKYKPLQLNDDTIWIPMIESNGGSKTTRGAIRYDTEKCYINLLCGNATAASAFGNIMYMY